MSIKNYIKKTIAYTLLAPIIGIAGYGAFRGMQNYQSKNNQPVISEYVIPYQEEKSNEANSLAYEEFINLDPAFQNFHAKEEINQILHTNVNKNSNKEILIHYRNGSFRNFALDVFSKIDGKYQTIYHNEQRGFPFFTNIDVRDLDNDGINEIIKEYSDGGSMGSGHIEILKCKNRICETFDTIRHSGGLKIKDLDGDGKLEILTGEDAPGQAHLSNASKKNWYKVHKLQDSKYVEIPNMRLTQEGYVTDSSDKNPYNLVQKLRNTKHDAPFKPPVTTYSDPSPSLENRIQDYTQPTFEENYNIYGNEFTERYLRLSLIIENKQKRPTTAENRIKNASIHFVVKPENESTRLAEDTLNSNHNGIVNLNYDFLLPKDQDAKVCIEINAPHYFPVADCFNLENLNNVKFGDKLGNFIVWKSSSNPGFYGDVTLLIEMMNPEEFRTYPPIF